MRRVLRAATRGSALALWQTDHVASLLALHGIEVEPVVVSTVGDRRLDVPIHAMGGKGVFSKEVQHAVLDGRADIAVHSTKDLPAGTVDGLVLAAVPTRGDARDALIGCRLTDLVPGARIGTGSVRRRAQLAARRPDLRFEELRGNIGTRLDRAGDFDAIVLAAAGVARLQRSPEIIDVLEPEVLLPQVGQGALAVECRADDDGAIEALTAIEHAPSRRVVDAERAFLAALGGDCDLPAGAYAVLEPGDGGTDRVFLRALLAAVDGSVVLRDERRGSDGPALGVAAARRLLDDGGRRLLADR